MKHKLLEIINTSKSVEFNLLVAEGETNATIPALDQLQTITEKAMIETATELHKKANEFCFVANSLNLKVAHQPIFKVVEVDEVEKSRV